MYELLKWDLCESQKGQQNECSLEGDILFVLVANETMAFLKSCKKKP